MFSKKILLLFTTVLLTSCNSMTGNIPAQPPSFVATVNKEALSISELYLLKIVGLPDEEIEQVTFQILSAATREVLFKSPRSFRTRDALFFLWDKDDRIWVYSGDLGVFVWEATLTKNPPELSSNWIEKNYKQSSYPVPEYLKQQRPGIFGPY